MLELKMLDALYYIDSDKITLFNNPIYHVGIVLTFKSEPFFMEKEKKILSSTLVFPASYQITTGGSVTLCST